MRFKKFLVAGALVVGTSIPAAEQMSKKVSFEELQYIGAMRLVNSEVPMMAGEYLNEFGDREYKGTILNPVANERYTNKECTYAGFYGSCTDKKDKVCIWYGKPSKQCE